VRPVSLRLLSAALALAAASAPAAEPPKPAPARAAFELPPRPEKDKPYAGANYVVPYEDVLDHAQLILVGTVSKHVSPRGEVVDGERKEFPGSFVLTVEKVLRGELKEKEVTVRYGGGALLEGVDKAGKVCAFLCIRNAAGEICLAGDPPGGGGFVGEGPELVDKLLVAAADPVKGYASEDFAVKLSSGCRLARIWLAKPAAERPAPPAGLIEVLLEGLRPVALRGPNVSASARDALNLIFDCNLNTLAEYSVKTRGVRRTKLAEDVAKIWERTVTAVRDRRAERARKPSDGPTKTDEEVARLIKKLGSENYPEREAAQQALLKIGKAALPQVQAGVKDQNEHIADHCKLLVALYDEQPTTGADKGPAAFNLDRAEPFVSAGEGKP
jgi:hypothetical protein